MSEQQQKVDIFRSYISQASETFDSLPDVRIELDDTQRLRESFGRLGLEECTVKDDVYSALSFAILGTESEDEFVRRVISNEVKLAEHCTLYTSMIEGNYNTYCNDTIMRPGYQMNKLLALKASCEAFLVRAVMFMVDHDRETSISLYTPRGDYRKVIYVFITSDFLKPLRWKQGTCIDTSAVDEQKIEQLRHRVTESLKEGCTQFFLERDKPYAGFGSGELIERLSLFFLSKKDVKYPDYLWIAKADEIEEYNETLLRSLSDQIYGDEESCQFLRFIIYCQLKMNSNLYGEMVAELTQNRHDYTWFCEEVSERRLPVHGMNQLFVQVIADVYHVRILEFGIHPDVLIKETLPYIMPYKKVLFICKDKSTAGSVGPKRVDQQRA